MIIQESFAAIGLALIVFLASLGGSAQQQVAQLSLKLGRRNTLLVVAALTAITSAAMHGWVGQFLAKLLPEPWQGIAAAIVLVAAAVRLMLPKIIQHLAEPTYSLGAITLVLAARQIFAPSGLVIIAAGIGGMALYPVVIAGALGGICGFAIAWQIPMLKNGKFAFPNVRLTSAALIIGCAIFIAIFV